MIQISRKIRKSSAVSVTHLITDNRLLITTALVPLVLSGCMGVYEGGFECPPGEGVGCKSISEVNQMVNQCSVPSMQCSEKKKSLSEIWYSPSFHIDKPEKTRVRCFDAANSI